MEFITENLDYILLFYTAFSIFSILYLSFSGKYRNVAMIGDRQLKPPFDTIYAMLFSVLASPLVATIVIVFFVLGIFTLVFSLVLALMGAIMFGLIYLVSLGKPFEEKNEANITLEDLFEEYDEEHQIELVDFDEDKTNQN